MAGCAAGHSPAHTPAAETGLRSLPTWAPAPCSTKPSQRSPKPTPTRTSGTTWHSPTRSRLVVCRPPPVSSRGTLRRRPPDRIGTVTATLVLRSPDPGAVPHRLCDGVNARDLIRWSDQHYPCPGLHAQTRSIRSKSHEDIIRSVGTLAEVQRTRLPRVNADVAQDHSEIRAH